MSPRPPSIHSERATALPRLSQLVSRDAALKGLELILDPPALTRELGGLFQWNGVQPGRLTYVRYKPGRRCLVLLDTVADGANQQFIITSHHAGHWDKELRRAARSHRDGRQGLSLLKRWHVTVAAFPADPAIAILPRLHSAAASAELLARLFPQAPQFGRATFSTLAYKPERRHVAAGQVGGEPRFVLKAYAPAGYPSSKHAARPFTTDADLLIPRRIARSRRHCLTAYEWLPGQLLSDAILDASCDDDAMKRVGHALAMLHAQEGAAWHLTASEDCSQNVVDIANDVAFLLPELHRRLEHVAARVLEDLSSAGAAVRPIHGDFDAKQVLVCDSKIGIVDFDQTRLGDPAADIGNFVAKLKVAALRRETTVADCERLCSAFVDGYRQRGTLSDTSLRKQTAAGLVRCLPLPFRSCAGNWPEATEAILQSIEVLLDEPNRCRAKSPAGRAKPSSSSLDAAIQQDERLSHAGPALHPAAVEAALEQCVPSLRHRYGSYAVTEARVIRHKPGRRCLIEYSLAIPNSQTPDGLLQLIGKVRAKGVDRRTYELQERLWQTGFDERSPDQVSIPQPIGLIPDWGMWLQVGITGSTAGSLLALPGGGQLAEQIAAALAKLHRSAIVAGRMHTSEDELRILRERFQATAGIRPELAEPLRQLLDRCETLAEMLRSRPVTGIHRDFYAEQVLVAGERIYLLDLDLYTDGDAALDAGNFVGHLIEQGLRRPAEAAQLNQSARRFSENFAHLSGCNMDLINTYEFLTLARHVALSTVLPDRSHTTPLLLEYLAREPTDL